MRIAALIALTALLAACGTTTPTSVDGPYFTQGYSDGCRTAEARRAAFDNRSFRNDELFAAQPSYQTGWRQGFRECQPAGIQPVQPTSQGQADGNIL